MSNWSDAQDKYYKATQKHRDNLELMLVALEAMSAAAGDNKSKNDELYYILLKEKKREDTTNIRPALEKLLAEAFKKM